MSSASKAPASKDRRKSDKSLGLITLTVSPEKLRAIFGDRDSSVAVSTTPVAVKVEDSGKASPPRLAVPALATPLQDSASDSTPNTPGPSSAPEGTPGPLPAMAPPAVEAASTKKKGVKRSAAAAGIDVSGSAGPGSTNGDATPRARSKPGPKKKAKLDDGAAEPSRGGAGGTHKLGPKASMGAINAGLRALDRSGKPCRKWAKGGFRLKTFTGVVWEIPRWKAPPKATPETGSTDESTTATASASVDGSNKENKETVEKTLNGAAIKFNGVNGTATNGKVDSDVDMDSAPSAQPSPPPAANESASTPVPIAVA